MKKQLIFIVKKDDEKRTSVFERNSDDIEILEMAYNHLGEEIAKLNALKEYHDLKWK